MAKLESDPHLPSQVEREKLEGHFELKRSEAQRYVQLHGVYAQDGFAGIYVPEIAELNSRILRVKNVFEAYDILAERPREGGACWYDRIVAPQHKRGYHFLRSTFQQIIPHPVESALDAGAGTGEATVVLAGFARHVTAMDMSMPMLKVAGKKLEKVKTTRPYTLRTYKLIQFDVTRLTEYPGESFDIAMSSAMNAYLDYDELITFQIGLHHVLKPGGRYYEYRNLDPKSPPEFSKSPRAALMGEVADNVFKYSFVKYFRQNGAVYFDSKQIGLTGGQLELRENGKLLKDEFIQVFEKI